MIDVKFRVSPEAKFRVPVIGRTPRATAVFSSTWRGRLQGPEQRLDRDRRNHPGRRGSQWAGEALDDTAALRTTWRAEKEFRTSGWNNGSIVIEGKSRMTGNWERLGGAPKSDRVGGGHHGVERLDYYKSL